MAVFVPNPAASKELDALPGMLAEKRRVAGRVRSYAIGFAPRGYTDDYVTSLDVVQHGESVYVRTNDFAGHMVEWGSIHNPPYAPIRRAVRAAGLRLDEERH